MPWLANQRTAFLKSWPLLNGTYFPDTCHIDSSKWSHNATLIFKLDTGRSLNKEQSEGGHIFPNNMFLSYLTLWLVSFTPRGFPIVNWIFIFFHVKSMSKKWKMKNRVHRVYDIQKDRLDIRINEFSTIWKIMRRSNVRVFSFNKFANISSYDAAFSKPLKPR